jgi:hypothetical protein
MYGRGNWSGPTTILPIPAHSKPRAELVIGAEMVYRAVVVSSNFGPHNHRCRGHFLVRKRHSVPSSHNFGAKPASPYQVRSLRG